MCSRTDHVPDLRGKVALVTGASGGIGLAVARSFLQAGARVVGCARSGRPLDAGFDYVPADIAVEADVEGLAGTIRRGWGRLDILVNNAGLLGCMSSLIEYPIHEWDRVMAVNVRGLFLVTRAVVPLMGRGGSIINVSSGYGVAGRPRAGAYGVSKFACEGFSQTLAGELAPSGIRVNVVDPGAVRTAMRAAVAPDEDPSRIPAPGEITPVFLFLASEASADITGQRLSACEFLKE